MQARQGLDEYLKKALKRTDVVGLETKCTALREKDQTFFNIPPAVQSPDGWCDASIWVLYGGRYCPPLHGLPADSKTQDSLCFLSGVCLYL